ncbi:MAG: hypothetical protein K2X03_21470 [Bryobacteraceae bacterium]|nr:hypothetical protein [Bryobacteraceae bacterium]
MPSTTIRVTPDTHETLRALAQEENLSIQSVVDKAVSEYHRRQILAQGNAAYAALRADPAAWAEELEERQAWEATLADGLDGQ